jgi:hypothetical protein
LSNQASTASRVKVREGPLDIIWAKRLVRYFQGYLFPFAWCKWKALN